MDVRPTAALRVEAMETARAQQLLGLDKRQCGTHGLGGTRQGAPTTTNQAPDVRSEVLVAEVPAIEGNKPRIVLAVFIGYSQSEKEIFVWS